MTREEAARIIDGAEVLILNRDVKAFYKASTMAIKALRELDAQEKLKPMNEWISVKDRLPEVPEGYERIQVIVRCCYGVDTAWVQRDTKKFYDIAGWLRSEVIGVTHWMPMPEPPKEEHHE